MIHTHTYSTYIILVTVVEWEDHPALYSCPWAIIIHTHTYSTYLINSVTNLFYIATGGEEIADLRGKLDALHQELDREEATKVLSLGLIKEKVKACFDQSQIAFNKVRMETTCLQGQINELTKQKLELENKVEALEQGINIDPSIYAT